MDHRDLAGTGAFKWYDDFDEAKMRATATVENDDGEEVEVEVECVYEVCSTCDGRGSHVNPAIDAHGIGEDEWSEWGDDEREGYLSGRYDVTCYECGGRRVVPVPREDTDKAIAEAIAAKVEADVSYAQECAAERRYCGGG